jgi:hypothetical protein
VCAGEVKGVTVQNVKCTVSNCAYWHNDVCRADAIEVNVENGGRLGQTSKDTICETFKPR